MIWEDLDFSFSDHEIQHGDTVLIVTAVLAGVMCCKRLVFHVEGKRV